MRSYYFKASLNIMNCIMEIIISRNASNAKNTGTWPKSVVRIRSVAFIQHQDITIIAASFEMSQISIIVRIMKNRIQYDSLDARQDRSRSKRFD